MSRQFLNSTAHDVRQFISEVPITEIAKQLVYAQWTNMCVIQPQSAYMMYIKPHIAKRNLNKTFE
jgi:hypothetical protein